MMVRTLLVLVVQIVVVREEAVVVVVRVTVTRKLCIVPVAALAALIMVKGNTNARAANKTGASRSSSDYYPKTRLESSNLNQKSNKIDSDIGSVL